MSLAVYVISLLSLSPGPVYAQTQNPQTCISSSYAAAYSSDGSMYVVSAPNYNTCTHVASGDSDYSATQPNAHYYFNGKIEVCGYPFTLVNVYDWAGGDLVTDSGCVLAWSTTNSSYSLGVTYQVVYPNYSGAFSQITQLGWSGNCPFSTSSACFASITASAPLP
jgi:hypothetical protein